MIFTQTALGGVWRVEWEPVPDERGLFARTFCGEEFARQGLPAVFEQSSLSRNLLKGTLRGLHFQAPPDAECKFVRCVRGAVYDVALDLRPGSPTRLAWAAAELSAANGVGLYIPEGVAHGFMTLTDDADVLYQITPAFRPGLGQGVRWDDPAFGIAWPGRPEVMSERDAAYPDYVP